MNKKTYELMEKRLALLHQYVKEEGSAGLGIDADSLRHFRSFLQSDKNLKCPTITLTPENNIYATWGDGRGQVFSVHFLPNGDASFVIFKLEERYHRTERLSGVTTADGVIATAKSQGIWSWILEGR